MKPLAAITRFHGTYSAQVAPFARAVDERKENGGIVYGLLPSMSTVDLLGGLFDHPVETRTINEGNGTCKPLISAHSFMCNRATICRRRGREGGEEVFVFFGRGVAEMCVESC